jgi:hypothetical protein
VYEVVVIFRLESVADARKPLPVDGCMQSTKVMILAALTSREGDV